VAYNAATVREVFLCSDGFANSWHHSLGRRSSTTILLNSPAIGETAPVGRHERRYIGTLIGKRKYTVTLF